ALVSRVSVAGLLTVLVSQLLDVVQPHHSAKQVSTAITAELRPTDVIAVEGSLEYSPAIPFYTGRRVLLVNGAVGYFSFASHLPEAEGVFLDTREFIRLWEGSRRVFLVVRRERGASVVAALPSGGVHDLGRYGSRWLYSNRQQAAEKPDFWYRASVRVRLRCA